VTSIDLQSFPLKPSSTRIVGSYMPSQELLDGKCYL
jgi:hypothetical protein